MGMDENVNEELTYAEILMQMAPGVNNRKRDSEVKKTKSKLLGSFKMVGKAIGRASNLFSIRSSKTNIAEESGGSSRMNLPGSQDSMNENNNINTNNKIESAKDGFGFIEEEEEEYDEEQW